MRRVLIYGLAATISFGISGFILYSVCELVGAIFGVHSSKFNVTRII